jgi:oligopeptide/dipeptide ABC transporter ATP-binding protein
MTALENTATDPSKETVLLSVRDLGVGVRADDVDYALVHDVSFDVASGEVVCLVGESGSGKSLTASAILGLAQRNSHLNVTGDVVVKGRDLTRLSQRQLRDVRGRDIGMIFQDPVGSLDPVIAIGKQVAEAVERQGGSRADVRRRVRELLTQVGISDPERRVKQFPHEISGGMCQRVAIATALAGSPALLIADEPTTALDVTIQAQVLDLLRKLRRDRDMSILLITHDMGVAAQTADRIVVMYAGTIVEEGPTREFFARPGHPYSIALIEAVPRVDAERVTRFATIPGSMPEARHRPSGCPFHPRCPLAIDKCRSEVPAFVSIGARRVACHRADEVQAGEPVTLNARATTNGKAGIEA